MTLKQLEAFYWAATCLNFSVAAERVHVSLSSLSKRIAELEASLGQPLFDRSGRSARLTPQGERMLPGARNLLHAATALQQSAASRRGLEGRCRLGLGEVSGLTWLPRFLSLAEREHPDLQIEPQVAIGQVLEQRVESGELDCVVITGPSSLGSLASEPVAKLECVWVASPDFLARAGHDRPERLIEEHTLISLPVGAGGTRIVDQWMAVTGTRLHRRLACNSWGAVVSMAVDGVGLAFMPRRWAEALAQAGSLRILSRGKPLPPSQITVQWRRDDARPLIGEMRRLIKQVIDFPAPRCYAGPARRPRRAPA